MPLEDRHRLVKVSGVDEGGEGPATNLGCAKSEEVVEAVIGAGDSALGIDRHGTVHEASNALRFGDRHWSPPLLNPLEIIFRGAGRVVACVNTSTNT